MMDDNEQSIKELSQEYLRAVDEAEAAKEELLSGWAEEFYGPGYLTDDEWQRLKDLMDADDTDHALMQLEIAIYRKVATAHGREHEFDDDWPAKSTTETDRRGSR